MKLELKQYEKIDLDIDGVIFELKRDKLGFQIERFDEDFSEPIDVQITREGIVKIDCKQS